MEAATLEAPATAAPPNAGGANDDAYASIEAMGTETGDKAPTSKLESAKTAPAKVEATPNEKKTTDDPSAKKGTEKAEATKGNLDGKPSEASAVKKDVEGGAKAGELTWKTAPKAFRDAHEVAKNQLREATEKLKALESATPKEFKIEEAPQFKSLKEKYDALAKKAEELENTVRYTNYEASEEFKTKYQEPYEKAAKLSTLSAQQLKITTVDAETGEEKSRNLTDAEFWDIVRQPDDESALSAAEKLFGKGSTRAARVADLRDKVVQAHDAAQRAKDEFKKNAGERARTIQEQQESFTKAQHEALTKHRDEALNNPKYAEWFKADEGDSKGAEMLENGMKWVDSALFGDLPPDKAAKNLAAIRNKAGAFDHVVHKLNTAKTQLKEARAKLAEYEASGPGNGAPPKGGDAAADDDSMEAAFSALEARAERG